MITFDKALEKVTGLVRQLGTESVDIEQAVNRILAEDVKSDVDIPGFDKSAMDGYAAGFEDIDSVPAKLKVVETIRAGDRPKAKIKAGECAKIMTGAVVPQGADCVVMVENTTEAEEGFVTILKKPQKSNICYKGEDCKKKKCILRKHTRLGPAQIGVLATVGKTSVAVWKKPSVGVIVTGGEIVEPDSAGAGQIRNSNGPMLAALASSVNCKVDYLGIVKDHKSAIKRKIEEAVNHDVLITLGGVSMGDYDYVPEVLAETGAEIIFHKVAVKPGKPILFAKRRQQLIFGIPGNPVSAFVTFTLFVKPALLKMQGSKEPRPNYLAAITSEDCHVKAKGKTFVPCLCRYEAQANIVKFVEYHGSADIKGLNLANGLVVFESGTYKINKGSTVKVLPI